MMRNSRWPVAVTCLGLGLACGLVANQQLVGQPIPAPERPLVPVEPYTFSPVVKRVLPAVVSIETKGRPAAKSSGPADDQDFGSGVIIDPSGVVLTNNHVVEGAVSVEVLLADGRRIPSRDIRRDPKSDVAIVKLEGKEPFPFAELGDSDKMEVGDRVLAFGSPFGLTGSVSHGIVSGKSRKNLRLNQYEDFIQTDAAVNPGSSGGPLVNLEGKVVGIAAAIKTRSGGFSGVGLCVASNLARAVSDQLQKGGVVRRSYLGIGAIDLDADRAKKLGLEPNTGAVVSTVHPDSPAAKSGVAAGDVVTAIGGWPVTDAKSLQKVITGLPTGRVVEVGVIRGGRPLVLHVTVEDQPPTFGTTRPAAVPAPSGQTPGVLPLQDLGLAVSDLSAEATRRLGYPANTKGALIVAVTRDSRAEKAGLKAGSVVVQVDRTEVTSAATFRQALAQASREKGAVLRVLRPTGDVEFAVLRLQ
jgi:serine protease Do